VTWRELSCSPYLVGELAALLSVEVGTVRQLVSANVSRDRGFRAAAETLGQGLLETAYHHQHHVLNSKPETLYPKPLRRRMPRVRPATYHLPRHNTPCNSRNESSNAC